MVIAPNLLKKDQYCNMQAEGCNSNEEIFISIQII